MDTIHFETGYVTAPTIALWELLECYQKSPEFPKDKQDGDTTKKAFKLIYEFMPNADTYSFGAKQFKHYKHFLIGKGYKRSYCNKFLSFVKAAFYWGMTEELVSESRAVAIGKVPIVKEGEAPDNPPRTDIPLEYIDELVPYLPAIIVDMLRLMILTAMRPGEMCSMTSRQISFNKILGCMAYEPLKHKTKRKRKERIIALNDEAMEIIKKYQTDNPDMPVFRNEQRYRNSAITVRNFSRTVKQAIERYGTSKFVPYQLRHTKLTEVSKEHGRDIARAFAGHSSETTIRIYDHSDTYKIKKVIGDTANVTALASENPPILRIYTGE